MSSEHDVGKMSITARVVNIIAVVLPFAGLITAIFLLWGWGFSWCALGVLLGMYVATVLGVTVGYHRLYTHRSFETRGVVKVALTVLGSMAAQGPLIRWVAVHRRHHQHSDEHGDPHSPHQSGNGTLGVLRGLWHAHMGWLFHSDAPNLMNCVRDLERSRLVRVVSALFPLWLVVGLVLPAVIGGVITLSWSGALLGFIWGGMVRIFLVHHVTWSVNSVCHMIGSRPFQTRDNSRNNLVFGVLALGEGWHNNHHAFPTSARHGLRWWQLDLSYLFIRALAMMNLAWNVRRPGADHINARTRIGAPST
ncbi:MAG: acyl-CoA desaturase [Phycisphaeraceae bacterium]|nr:acyl-CoA desaturase [Phycisphaeraceae bacterium]